MSLDREIQRLKSDPPTFLSLVRTLMRYPEQTWTEWERTFLEAMSQARRDEPPSTRQCEKLLELRDNARSYRTIEGFSVRRLIEETWRAKDELDEEDEEFLAGLYQSGSDEIKRRPLRRLLTCARKVEVIQTFIHLD